MMTKRLSFLFFWLLLSANVLAVEDIFVTDTMTVSMPADIRLRNDYLQALCFKKAGKVDSAIVLLNHYISQDQQNASVYCDLANMLIAKQDYKEAQANMKKAALLAKKNYWIQRAYALCLIQNGDRESAIAIYEKLAADNPQHTDDLIMLAKLLEQKGDLKGAIKKWNLVEREQGIADESTQEKCQLYMRLKDKKKVLAEMDRLAAFSPTSAHLMTRASAYAMFGYTGKAVSQIHEIIREYPAEKAVCRQLLAAVYIDDNNPNQVQLQIDSLVADTLIDFGAKQESFERMAADTSYSPFIRAQQFEKFIELYPNNDQSYLLYANYFFRNRDTTGYRYVAKALEINPQNADSWLIMLDYKEALHDSAQFVSSLNKALSYFPNNGMFLYMKGSVELSANHVNSALSLWKRSASDLEETEDKMRLSFVEGAIGDAYMRLLQLDSASVHYEKSLAISDKNNSVLNNYAYTISIMKGDLVRAEKLSGKAIAREPKNAAFLDTYAWICFCQKNYLSAELYIQQALNYGGSKDKDVVEHYGDILYCKGDTLNAVKYWTEAQTLIPSSDSLLQKKIELKKYISKEDYDLLLAAQKKHANNEVVQSASSRKSVAKSTPRRKSVKRNKTRDYD